MKIVKKTTKIAIKKVPSGCVVRFPNSDTGGYFQLLHGFNETSFILVSNVETGAVVEILDRDTPVTIINGSFVEE